MSLYLIEARLDVSTAEKRAQIMERVAQVIKEGGTPDARLVAGPWGSVESPIIFAVLDIPDPDKTIGETMQLYNDGLLLDRRLRPIMSWDNIQAAAAKVS